MVPAYFEKGGSRLLEVPHDMRRKETLSADMVRTVTEWAIKAEEHFGSAQDIEWACAGENLYVLQSRDVAVGNTERTDYSGLERWNKKSEPDEDEIVWTRAWSDEVLTRAITPLFYSVQAEILTAWLSEL